MKKVMFLMIGVLALGLVFAGCGNMLNVTLPTGEGEVSRAVSSEELYLSNGGSDSAEDGLYTVDLSSGDAVVEQIYSFQGVDYFDFVTHIGATPDGGTIYVVGEDLGHLGEYDVVGGTFSDLGHITGYPGDVVQVAVSPDDELFIVSKSTHTLYKVNVAGPSATAVGTGLGINVYGADIAFGADGTLYLYSAGSLENLYTVDTTTGEATLVGNSGITITGLAIRDSGLGDLVGSDTGDNTIITIDKDTAATGATYDMKIDDGTGNLIPFDHTWGDMTVGTLITIEEIPAIDVEKVCPPEFAYVGDEIEYNYNVCNTGDGALLDVTLEDDQLGAIALTGLTDEDGDGDADDLAYGACATGTADYIVQEGDTELVNTATASSTSAIDDSTVEATSEECVVEVCYEETAFGGDTGVNVDAPGPWFYYFEAPGVGEEDKTEKIWAGQHYEAGEVTVSECEEDQVIIEIDLAEGWYLADDDEAVKIQGYDEIPDERPAAGLFTYKDNNIEDPIEVECYPYYIIHLDLQHCGDGAYEPEE